MLKGDIRIAEGQAALLLIALQRAAMMLRKTVSPAFLAFTLFGLCWSFIAWSEDLKGLHLDDSTSKNRVALIIGNGNYSTAPLKNSVNDARAMAQALKSLGFEVVERQNATKNQMEDAVGLFGEKISNGAVALFYYSGHGVQVGGKNYLVPVDADITSEQMVPLRAIDLDLVLTQMTTGHNSAVNLVILDACRNNPFERRFRTSVGSGLAPINAPVGTLIAYATAPGHTAADGSGENGLYTQELLRVIREPGLPIEEVFKRVRSAVRAESRDAQIPWESSSLEGNFFFAALPGSTVTTSAPPVSDDAKVPLPSPAKEPASLPSVQNGKFGWLGVQVQRVPTALSASLKMKPDVGVFVRGVVPNSPAAAGGLRNGDVIVGIDGIRVFGPIDFVRRIAAIQPGTTTMVGVMHDGLFQRLHLTLGSRPGGADGFGATVSPLTP